MILLFLGSWRSTLIVCISIPLSILTSLIILNLMGQTINVMTLGGLALAVGILVDDATVEIENTHRNMAMKKPLVRAVLDGAQQIAVPAFVSTLSICIVFVPVLLLTGAAKYLFTPLALAVVFAMLASYLLSRTLIPTMVHYLLKPEVKMYRRGEHGEGGRRRGTLSSGASTSLQPPLRAIAGCLHGAARLGAGSSRSGAGGFMLFAFGSLGLIYFVGQRFFPHRRFRPDAPARSRSLRHAHRADRGALRQHRKRDPPRDSGAMNWIPSSITSASPTAASTWPSATIPPSAPATAIS